MKMNRLKLFLPTPTAMIFAVVGGGYASVSWAQVEVGPLVEKPDLSQPELLERPPMDPYSLSYTPQRPDHVLDIRSREDCTKAGGEWKKKEIRVEASKWGWGCEIDGRREGLFTMRRSAYFDEIDGYVWYKNNQIEGWYTEWMAPGSFTRYLIHFKDGKRDGYALEWGEDGSLRKSSHYKDGVLDGKYEAYQECLPVLLGQYRDGQPFGIWERYVEPGMITTRTDFDRRAPESLNLPENAYWAEWYNGDGVRLVEGYTVENTPDDESMFYVGDLQLYSTKGQKWLKVHYNALGQNDDQPTFELCKLEDQPEAPKPAYISYAHDDMIIYCKDRDENITKKIYYYATGEIWKLEPITNDEAHGLVHEYYPTGEKLSSYRMVRGVPDGDIIYYDKSGAPISQTHVTNGTGTWKSMWFNGKVREEGRYDSGVKTGRWVTYFDTGNINTETEYNDYGVENGVSRSYFSNGVIGHEAHYANGLADGEWKSYFTDGRMAREGRYVRGNIEGAQLEYLHSGGIEARTELDRKRSALFQTRYYEDGSKRAEGNVQPGFSALGILMGTWSYYLKDGTKWLTLEYEYGDIRMPEAARCMEMGGQYALDDIKREMGCAVCGVNRQAPLNPRKYREGKWQWWNENGRLETTGSFRFGHYDGKWSYYYAGGGLMLQGGYALDRKTGIWEGYYEDGSPKFKGEYKDGVESGLWETYHATTKNISSSGVFDNGKRVGEWVYHYASGAIRSRGEMKDGKETGLWVEYYENGAKRGEGQFEKGKQSGTWTWWREDGSVWRTAEYVDGKEVTKKK